MRFNRPGFMHGDVTAVGGNHSLPRAQDTGDDGRIGLRAANEEMHVRRGIADERADNRPRRFTMGVKAVTSGLFEVGRGERFQNGRVAAGEVVIATLRHVWLLMMVGTALYTYTLSAQVYVNRRSVPSPVGEAGVGLLAARSRFIRPRINSRPTMATAYRRAY